MFMVENFSGVVIGGQEGAVAHPKLLSELFFLAENCRLKIQNLG